jgi:hypothetical protein
VLEARGVHEGAGFDLARLDERREVLLADPDRAAPGADAVVGQFPISAQLIDDRLGNLQALSDLFHGQERPTSHSSTSASPDISQLARVLTSLARRGRSQFPRRISSEKGIVNGG